MLTIEFSSVQYAQLKIISLNGHVIKSYPLKTEKTYEVNLNSLAEGYYFYEIITPHQKRSGSLLILR